MRIKSRLKQAIATCALAAGLGLAVPALAQDPANESAASSQADDLAELREQIPALMEQLNVLATQLGVEELPPVDWDRFLNDFSAALPMMPEGDERAWGSAVDFEFKTTSVTTNGAAGELDGDDEDAQAIIGDAAGCIRDEPNARVVHFRRIRQEDLRGHQCVFTAETDTDVWVLYSRTYAEGHGRRLTARYGVAVAVEEDIAAARALGEPKIEAQVAVASSIANYALSLMDLAPAAGPATAIALPVRQD